MRKFKGQFFLMICLLFVGCNNNTKLDNSIDDSMVNEKVSEQQSVIDGQDERISEKQYIIDNQNIAIQENMNDISELEEQLNLKSLTDPEHVQSIFDQAPNGKYAVIIMTIDLGARFAYLCNLETEHSVFIESNVPAQTYWSSDSNYFILDEGTGQSRWGNIYLAETCERIDEIKYRGVLYWLNEKEFGFVEENNNIKINTGTELECTTNIVKYNVETKEQKTLLEGNSEYYFYINMVNEDGTIKVSKNYMNSSQDVDAEYFTLTTD